MTHGVLRPASGPIDAADDRDRLRARLAWGPADDPHATEFDAGWLLRRSGGSPRAPAGDAASAAHLSGWIARDERADRLRAG